jgi:hypothetical protein
MADRTSDGGSFFGPAIIVAVLAAIGIGPSLVHQRDDTSQLRASAIANQKASSSENAGITKYSADHLLSEFFASEHDPVEEKKR